MSGDLTKYLDSKKYWGIFLLRLFISFRLIYGVIDNILSWDKMIEFSIFLSNNGFPFPKVSAVISVYTQFIFAMLIFIGYKTRLASAVLIINFLVALIFVHIKAHDTIEGMTPALAMLFGCITFTFTGPGKISLDERLKSNSLT